MSSLTCIFAGAGAAAAFGALVTRFAVAGAAAALVVPVAAPAAFVSAPIEPVDPLRVATSAVTAAAPALAVFTSDDFLRGLAEGLAAGLDVRVDESGVRRLAM
jgi:hypothetical protein